MIICSVCHDKTDPAPSGDARNIWLDYHHGWPHRLYWKIKSKLK